MASLTKTSIISRKAIRYGIYALILITVARFAINTGTALYQRIFPNPPPDPTVGFGRLTNLPVSTGGYPENLSFTLQTADGQLPTLPEQAKVYSMPTKTSSITDLDEARSKARALGFRGEGEIVVQSVPNVYVFGRGEASQMNINIITDIFSISHDIGANPGVFDGLPPDSETAIRTARSILSRASSNPEDLNGPAETKLLRLQDSEFVSAVSLSEADITEVNLYRSQYGGGIERVDPESEGYPAVTPEGDRANVWFWLARGNTIIAAEYHYFPVNEDEFETYPLITAQNAWDKLQAGEGFIANLGNNENGNIVVRRAYLAYFDAGQYTQYYQPVVVFEGDNDFMAYVPAVADEYYGAEPEDNNSQ